MLPQIIPTADGSNTLFNKVLNETYHSVKGACTESMHVFIKEGFQYFISHNPVHVNDTLNLLEVGFGTGLNAILTFNEAQKNNIRYDALENNPLPFDFVKKLGYESSLNDFEKLAFRKMHQSNWNETVDITETFALTKMNQSLLNFVSGSIYHIIYFDAFGPEKQPEMWTESVFQKMYDAMHPGGILVTYSAKGTIKNNMRNVGFEVCRLDGPPGKRHMVRGYKIK
ncbi:MAG: tRNA (5-methylaminomethyl-2-thiouridine)(34)-methyltransferase MnmD [Bacteroidota bacterium]|nr:tRNA (5-methylaminomethyl-2-thiouridine)(34)-methyltransferase MnmD [Bacteroidota bacterium]